MIGKSNSLVITGGHHTGSLVVAKTLRNHGWTIFWVGHRHSMWGDTSDSAEYREVTSAGFPFFDLKAGKLYRTFHPLKLLRLPFGFFQAFFYLLQLKRDPRFHLKGIVSFGGYLAVPTVISGWLLGIPGITHEQTVAQGWANRFLVPFVRKIAVSWPSSLSFYPASKSVLTGLPLRPEILHLSASPAPSLHRPKTIYFTGGKQGSHIINQTVFNALPQLLTKYRIIHQTGSSTLYHDYDISRELSHIHSGYESFDFDSEKALAAFSRADLIVSRSGAHTIYELAVLGKPSVLIPIPWVSHDEQNRNAQLLVSNHQAVVLPEVDLSPDHLLSAISAALSLSSPRLNVPVNGLDSLVQLIEQEFA